VHILNNSLITGDKISRLADEQKIDFHFKVLQSFCVSRIVRGFKMIRPRTFL
jgi:hypothetical protein